MVLLVDTHAHLSDDALWAERDAILAEAKRAGVCAVLSVGYDRATSARALDLARNCRWAGPTVGIHPTSIPNAEAEDFEAVSGWAALPEVVAIGETGLDFYWDTSPPERQREVFRWHLHLARQHRLPVTLHSRNAEEAVLDELENCPASGAAMHCFGGSQKTARRALDLGCYIGVGGPVTFKKSTELQQLVQWLPLDRILLETDSPYLSPHPLRGKRNEPTRVRLIAEKIAELRGVSLDELAVATTQNAFNLYPRLQERSGDAIQ